MNERSEEIRVTGIAVSKGIAVGKLFYFSPLDGPIPEFDLDPVDVEAEVERYRLAVTRGQEELVRLKSQCEKEKAHEGIAILESHLELMQDPLMIGEVEGEIRAAGKNAEFVFRTVIERYRRKFDSLADPFFRERFNDVRDVARRVLGYLKESFRRSIATLPENSILFAAEFLAGDVAEMSPSRTVGLVTRSGGVTSHAAIVSRAKGIPLVTNIDFEALAAPEGALVIVDGNSGDVFINPQEEVRIRYERLRDAESKAMRTTCRLPVAKAEIKRDRIVEWMKVAQVAGLNILSH